MEEFLNLYGFLTDTCLYTSQERHLLDLKIVFRVKILAGRIIQRICCRKCTVGVGPMGEGPSGSSATVISGTEF